MTGSTTGPSAIQVGGHLTEGLGKIFGESGTKVGIAFGDEQNDAAEADANPPDLTQLDSDVAGDSTKLDPDGGLDGPAGEEATGGQAAAGSEFATGAGGLPTGILKGK